MRAIVNYIIILISVKMAVLDGASAACPRRLPEIVPAATTALIDRPHLLLDKEVCCSPCCWVFPLHYLSPVQIVVFYLRWIRLRFPSRLSGMAFSRAKMHKDCTFRRKKLSRTGLNVQRSLSLLRDQISELGYRISSTEHWWPDGLPEGWIWWCWE